MSLSDSDRIAAWRRLEAFLDAGMPRPMAEDVRRWRCERELTWRGIAEEWTRIYGRELLDWPDELDGLQDLGNQLCEAASKVFGENHMAPPRN